VLYLSYSICLEESSFVMIGWRSSKVGKVTMAQQREKFATQVNSEVLRAVRDLADKEGRQLQALVDEALTDLIEKRRNANARAHVMAQYQASHNQYAGLYQKLAK
jgi:hypothetical protein